MRIRRLHSVSQHKRTSRIVALFLLLTFTTRPSLAHNEVVHRDMVDLTYQLMRLSLAPTRLQAITLFAPPEGADPNEWAAYLAAVRSAPPKYHNRPSDLGKLKAPKTTTCSQAMYNDKVLPDRWWDKKAGELNYPVAIDFEDSGDWRQF